MKCGSSPALSVECLEIFSVVNWLRRNEIALTRLINLTSSDKDAHCRLRPRNTARIVSPDLSATEL